MLDLPFIQRALVVVFLASFTSCACAKIAKPTNDDQNELSTPAPLETYGEKLGASELVPLADALNNPANYSQRPIKVRGHVRRACSAKGCWMELAQDQSPTAPACRVTFKDYGFFVPTDSAGAEATIEGQLSVKRVRAAQVKHYEGEGATFASKHEDGSADEVRFVATGVELRRR
jgi:hypothetical protein